MLTHLYIRNFTIIKYMEIGFDCGLNVISGATGAGKSIVLEALALVLGKRINATVTGSHGRQAEISALFDVGSSIAAQKWLNQRGIEDEEQADSCLLRRIVGSDGKSRSFINGNPVTVREVRDLSGLLAAIYGQNAQFTMLSAARQSELLSDFGDFTAHAAQLRAKATEYQQLQDRLAKHGSDRNNLQEQLKSLRFQLEELEAIGEDLARLAELKQQHSSLSHSQELLQICDEIQQITHSDKGMEPQLGEMIHNLQNARQWAPELNEPMQLLQTAREQINEATQTIARTAVDFAVNPELLQELETRLTAIYTQARRHRVAEQQLATHYRELCDRAAEIEQQLQQLEQQSQSLADLKVAYRQLSETLTGLRSKHGSRLAKQINSILADLAMPNCRFSVAMQNRGDNVIHPDGCETVHFMVSTNPPQPPQPMEKIASGGELSRLSLALQVVSLGAQAPACLVFDEVDNGVGSKIAAIIGQQLEKLASRCQVLCVTHMAQIAGRADHHYVADKKLTKSGETESRLTRLGDSEARVAELSRMLASDKITDRVRAHAEELIKNPAAAEHRSS